MAKNLSFLFAFIVLCGLNSSAQSGISLRDGIQKTYNAAIGVRERTGRNDGVDVEKYLAYVWLKPGNPWCAAFVSWTLGQSGVKKARSGGCVALMEQGTTIYRTNKLTRTPGPGDVFFIYYPTKKRVAHTGFVDKWESTYLITVEGNTNEAGSREGDGVYRKRRLKSQIYAVSTYLN
ncbi:CHAP domain-containing protein [Pedobacter terrae]|uniref:CHAP domain-containing protein n=1 Tax=Pedobacter terrae TaxID=405671 RepID=A0A1G7W856_9SPHI|nr:CHAP domain-containing protein [Pedobacter terrae]SDG68174.1 CHAP domain-containing protein [Pedobacter terrae]